MLMEEFQLVVSAMPVLNISGKAPGDITMTACVVAGQRE
jgi:hypothetical protein